MSRKTLQGLGIDRRARRRLLRRAAVVPDGSWVILELVPDAAIVVDDADKIAGANARAEEAFGYARGTLVGTDVRDILPGGDQGARWSVGARQTETSTPLHARRRDGSEFAVELSVSGVKASSGSFVLAVVRDVTSRIRADGLRAAEKTVLEMVASGASLNDVLLALTSGIEGVSRGVFASVLLMNDEGTELIAGTAPSLPDDYVRAVSRVPVGPRVGSCGTAAYRKELVIVEDIATDPLWEGWRGIALAHGLRSCWSQPIVTPDGSVLGTFAIYDTEPKRPSAEDIFTVERAAHLALIALQRHRVEQIRRETEGRYKVLSELTSDFAYAFSFGPDGAATIDWVTDAFSRITGYTVDEWKAMGAWRGLVHPDDLLAFEQRVPRLMRGEEVASDVRIVTKGGDVRWLSVYTRPIFDAERSIIGVVGAAQDFTSRKEAEDAKTLFLATASHELKTPLTVIQGFAQLVGHEDATGEIEREAADAIGRRARQLNKIVDRILLSSRIETGRTAVELTHLDIVPILAERTSATALAVDRDVVLETGDLPVVMGDHDAVTTVIDHLVENAIKYSPDGGPVEVRARALGGAVQISVTDHGIGMSPDQVARCFEKFWQAEQTDVRRFGGTGIGLYIVRSLTEAMGGSVDVDSIEGLGSTFTVTLRTVAPSNGSSGSADRGMGERTSIREFMRQMGVPGREKA